MVDCPGWKAEAVAKGVKTGKEHLQKFYDGEKMGIQARGSRGESGGETGCTYDLSNKYRLGYSEVELVTMMINGINKTWELELKKQEEYKDSLEKADS
jgi:protein-arginine kinase